MSVISQLNHPSIVKFVGYCSHDFIEEPKPTIIRELLSYKSLDYILQKGYHLEIWDDTQQLINIFGIASAMSYLHSHNIIHRDLKPQNIYFDDFFFPKISGFHLSKELPANEDKEICDSIKGTPVYLSPEVYLNKEYGKASDVYAFSYVVYEIMTSQKPFQDLTNVSLILEEVVKNQKRPEFNEKIPFCYQNLIKKCWSHDPSERPTFDEIVNTLRTDPSFITDTVNEEDYRRYIKLIDESNITFNPGSKITYEDITDKSLEEFNKNESIQTLRFSILGVYETEINNISLNFEYIDLKNFEELELIGTGSFSDVTKIRDKRTGIEYAAKYLTKNIKYSKIEHIKLSREVNYISQMNHPSIVKFVGFSPSNFQNKPFPILITELAPNRSLNKTIEMVRKRVEIPDWDDTKNLIEIYGIASAMAYLHSKDIIHRDLKTANILLDEHLFPKLFDFDVSCELSAINLIEQNVIGTPLYMAPETIKEGIYSKKTDVYSFAIIMYEIITNLNPYPNVRSANQIFIFLMKKNGRPEIPNRIPQCYRDLIQKCWATEPDERPSFDEILITLKTDPSFITEDVDEEEYKKYIKYIDEAKNGLEYHSIYDKDNENKSNSFTKIDLSSYLNEKIEAKTIISKVKNINLHKYEKQKSIGSGSFGNVYKVLEKDTGNVYAAKISKTYLTQCKEDDTKNLEREINIISKLNHPGILKFIGFNSCDFKGKSKPIIITEFVTNGSLEDILELEKRSCGNPNWDDTKKLICIYGIASAMKYLHSKEIIHRDLKPANILIDDYLFPKISDFGLSKDIGEEDELLLSGFKGTYAYSAPEIFENKYSKAGDVYAFSIIVYEIMTNEFPYSGFTPYQLSAQIPKGLRPEFKFDIPDCYRNLIESCWANNPEERPTFENIVDLLKTDEEFITENVDLGEFLDYVDYVDDYQTETGFELKQFDIIYQNSIVENLNLDQFKLSDKFDEDMHFEKYKLISKKTKDVLTASVFKSSIKKIPEKMTINIAKGLNIFSQLNHPSLDKLIGYSPVDFDSKQHPIIVSETSSKKGTLKNAIQEMNETDKLIVIYGIASGMRYLHSKDVIRRKLSTSRIFVDDQFHPKISSLEFAMNLSQESENEKSDFLGDYSYSAPDVFQLKYSKARDVYAFAMITYEILTGKDVYNGLLLFKIQYQTVSGIRPEFTSNVPSCYRRLVEECWSQEPSERPTFDEIVRRLKTDEDFLTDKIDRSKFFEYVDALGKSEQTVESHIDYSKINSLKKEGDLIESKTTEEEEEASTEKVKEEKKTELKFEKVSVNFEKPNEEKEEDEANNEHFLGMSKYKLGDLIGKQDYFKTYIFTSRETDKTFSAKISTVRVSKFSRDELISLSREVNIISQLHHPSFLKFVGCSPVDFKGKKHPVIVTELAANGTLRRVLESERSGVTFPQWDDTQRLIVVYGIAAGMMYLHSKGILHRDLNPDNVFLDEFLLPKIGDFGLSTRNHSSDTMTYQSTAGMKGNPTYSAPEVLQFNEYSACADVYAFGFVVFEIMTSEVPFGGIANKNQIFSEVVTKGNRPRIPESVTESCRSLIEGCWAQAASERPTFEEVVRAIRDDRGFITEKVEIRRFSSYVEFVEEAQKSFDSTRRVLDLKEFIEAKSKIVEEGDANESAKQLSESDDECEVRIVEKEDETVASLENSAISSRSILDVAESTDDKCKIIEEDDANESAKETKEEQNVSYIESPAISTRNILDAAGSTEDKCKIVEREDVNELAPEKKEDENCIIEKEDKHAALLENPAISARSILDVAESTDDKSKIVGEDDANESAKVTKEDKHVAFLENPAISARNVFDLAENTEDECKTIERCNVNESAKEMIEPEGENCICISGEGGDDEIESLKKLAMKYSKENDAESAYLCMKKLIDAHEFEVPVRYAADLYNKRCFEATFKYFELAARFNHPIARYFVGVMKFYGLGCDANRDESRAILESLSDNGIDKATEFIEEKFNCNNFK